MQCSFVLLLMVQVDVGTFPLLLHVHVFVSVLDSFEFVLISVSLPAVSCNEVVVH